MSIVEQLTSYCDCVNISEEDLAEMVNIVSAITCWRKNDCETFLTAPRKELFELKGCHECGITFEPFYHPYDKDSFKFYLVSVTGTTEEVTEITDYSYSEIEELFRINLGIECDCNQCGCETTHKLYVTYNAGYEELPDCILPVFCNLLEIIKAKNTCDCTCSCEGEEEQTIKYYSGDVVSVALETDLGKMLVEGYKDELAKISLCNGLNPLWGVVV